MRQPWTRTGLDLHLDLTGGALRAALEASLREAIRSGRLTAGAALPSSRSLAHDLGVSRGVVVQAFEQLTAEGYLLTRPRSATRVAPVSTVDVPVAASVPTRAAVHDFRPGDPDLGSFPRQHWLAAVREAAATLPNADLGYGDPRGHWQLRRSLAEYLARVRGVRATPECVLITDGFAHGLDLICTALRHDGANHVLVEDPSLPSTPPLVAGTGLIPVDIPADTQGLDSDHLCPADAAVVTPAHHLPFGKPLPARRRVALLEWARDTGALVVEDDYDGEFRYDQRPVGALQGPAADRVVYAGTASKSLAPGIRLGWLVLPPDWVDAVTAVRTPSNRPPPVLDQLAFAHLITSGRFDRHLRRVRSRYRHRHAELREHLAATVPAVRPLGVAAGLQTTLTWDHDVNEATVVAALAERGVAVHGLREYARTPPGLPGVVVNFARPPGHEYTAALEALTSGLRGTLGL